MGQHESRQNGQALKNAQRKPDWSFAKCPLDLKHAILQRRGFASPDRNIESHDENFASLGWVMIASTQSRAAA